MYNNKPLWIDTGGQHWWNIQSKCSWKTNSSICEIQDLFSFLVHRNQFNFKNQLCIRRNSVRTVSQGENVVHKYQQPSTCIKSSPEKGYLESGRPFLPYAHSGSISNLAFSPLLIVSKASSHWKQSLGEHVSITSIWILHQISTHSSDDSAHANFETQGLCLLFLSCCCRDNSWDILITRLYLV